MLDYLSIKNLSVIRDISLDFTDGLTIFTGETGAGKSVTLSALKLILGDRFQRSYLRDGSSKLSVEALFSSITNLPEDLKDQFEIVDDIIIKREIDSNGKNKIFINGKLSTLAQLRNLAIYLADIHSQHENQFLLDHKNHLLLVDHLVAEDYIKHYKVLYTRYKALKDAYDIALKESVETVKSAEIISYQINQIDSANIDIDNDSCLDEKIYFLSNLEKVRTSSAISLFSLTEGDVNASILISKTIKSLDSISQFIPDLGSYIVRLNEMLDTIEDISRFLSSFYNNDDDPTIMLDTLIQRRYIITDLIKKYAPITGDLNEVLNRADQMRDKLASIDSTEQHLINLKSDYEAAYKDAYEYSCKLLDERIKCGEMLSSKVVSILNDLELPNSVFFIKFNRRDELDELGGIYAEFYLSLNPGFEPAPLNLVASGGEVSRVMLALKEVFSDVDFIDTLVFDEIDTGISGKTAKRVADRIKLLSNHKQVIVITHLPVVAAAGNAHYHISKSIDDGISKTSVSKLDTDSRRIIIASMISGSASDLSLKQADELLELYSTD